MVSALCRPGHSLPELIVAVTLLGAALGAVSAMAVLATGWTSGAVLQQEGVRQTAAVLDSLLTAPLVEDGERRRAGVAVRWTARGAGSGLELAVTATGPDGRALARLEAPWFPPQPILPWPGEPTP